MKTYFGKKDMVDLNESMNTYGLVHCHNGNGIAFDDSKMVVFYLGASNPSVVEYGNSHLDAVSLQNTLGIDLTSITDLKLPYNVSTIDPHAFDGMENLTALTFPYTTLVDVIEEDTFKDCQNLKSLKLGFGISRLESGAFQNATSLETLHMPVSLEHIATTALENAPSALNEFKIMEMNSVVVGNRSDEVADRERTKNQLNNTSTLAPFLSKHLQSFEVDENGGFSYVRPYTVQEADNSSQDQQPLLRATDVYQFMHIDTYCQGHITVIRGPVELKVTERMDVIPPREIIHLPGERRPYPDESTPCAFYDDQPPPIEIFESDYTEAWMFEVTYVIPVQRKDESDEEFKKRLNDFNKELEGWQERAKIGDSREVRKLKLRGELQRKLFERALAIRNQKPTQKPYSCAICGGSSK